MRIAFLIRSLEIGGAQRQLSELAIGLHRQGWRVTVLTFYGGGALEADLRALSVSVENLGKRGRWDVLHFVSALVRSLKRDRPHILHGYMSTANMLAILMRPLFPRMRVAWGVRASNMDFAQYDDWLAGLDFKVSCTLARLAHLTIYNSAAGRSFHVAHGYPVDRGLLVPNGIDTHRFSRDRSSGLKVRSEWDVEAEALLVGIVGRLDPMKDHGTFLRAAALVARQRSDVRFVCIGEGSGSHVEGLRALASELGLDDLVTWAGARLDMPAAYSALDLVVSSSAFGEGFANVIAEAMSTSIPCVVTDVGDSADVVADTGWVCPPRDASRLAATILQAISDRVELERRAIAARQRIVLHFGCERLVQTTAGHLASLVPGAGSAPRGRASSRGD